MLDVLGDKVSYFHTDSVIFKTDKSDDLSYLPIGNYFWEMTTEIHPEDCHIIEFVSGDPQNYVYHTLSGKKECKVKFYFELN